MRFIAGLISLCFLAVACRLGPTGARVDPAIAPLIPSSTVVLAGLRLDKLKRTQFHRTYVEGKRIPQLEEFARRTGLDPRKDVSELVLAGMADRRALVFARGKFGDVFALEPQIKTEGVRRTNYKGTNILGTSQAAVMFVQSEVAVLGADEDLRRIVDNRGNPNEKPPQALLDLVGRTPAASGFYVVSSGPHSLFPQVSPHHELRPLAAPLSGFQELVLAADLSGDVKVQVQAELLHEAMAKQSAAMLRGLLLVRRLSIPDDRQQLRRLYDDVAIRVKGKSLTVAFSAPFDVLQGYVAAASLAQREN